MFYGVLLEILLWLAASDIDAPLLVNHMWHATATQNRNKLPKRVFREVTLYSTGPDFGLQAATSGGAMRTLSFVSLEEVLTALPQWLVDSHVIRLGNFGIQLDSALASTVGQFAMSAAVEEFSLSGSDCADRNDDYLLALVGNFSTIKRVCMRGLRASSGQISSDLIICLLRNGAVELGLPRKLSDERYYSASFDSLLHFLTDRPPSAQVRLTATCASTGGHYAYAVSQHVRSMPALGHRFYGRFRPECTILDASIEEHRHMHLRSGVNKIVVQFGQRQNAFLHISQHKDFILSSEFSLE